MKRKTFNTHIKVASLWAVAAIVPLAWLELLRRVTGAPFSPIGVVARWILIAAVLLAAQLGRLEQMPGGRWRWPWPGLALAGVTVAAALGYAWTQAARCAWLALGGFFAVLLVLAEGYWVSGKAVRRRLPRLLGQGLVLAGTVATSGLVPVLIEQLENRFSGEEFFAFVTTIALSVFVGLLLGVHLWLSTRERSIRPRPGLRLDLRWVVAGLLLLAMIGGLITIRAYQASFYPPEAPTFLGISAEPPFFCGEAPPSDGEHPDGVELFQRLLALVEANPHKGAPELGMLALARNSTEWAEAFQEAILQEAHENRFAGPAHSVKSTQYEAALRLYYLWRVQGAFPDLFTPADLSLLRAWFAAINQRALTVEWVDWMYALAFSKWPEGPYDNQENGAGLLALLEVSGYAAPELSDANRNYLARDERGWQERFRNNDDAYIYQLEWLNNALFQSLYTGRFSERNRQLSFEWLLLQSLPDGAVLGYNHPAHVSAAGTAYLGAQLLDDPRLLWMAGQALTQIEAKGGYLFAQPGLEEPVPFSAEPPRETSCLLYGDSGLPNQLGPLAPDKIVFRDGWAPDSTYALLNLRFVGWHRYKATNTLTLVYQNGPLVTERTIGQPFAWLPEGRSLFRDKRIPRENLNGLLVERTGMSAVLYQLTGVGGPWAQDPPFYAEVIAFETGDELDWSHTRLTGWRGWQHDRWVYFYHDGGPIVVVDEAEGPQGGRAALAWHLIGEGAVEGRRICLRGGDDPAEMLLMPVGPEGRFEVAEGKAGHSDLRVVYYALADGRLRVVTLFLLGRWAGAEVGLDVEEQTLWIARGQTRVTLPLPLGE